MLKMHYFCLPPKLADTAISLRFRLELLKSTSLKCYKVNEKNSSSVRRTHVATGITARERMAARRVGKVSDVIPGFVLRRLSPSSAPEHWKSWDGADASSIPDPLRNSSQRLRKMFQSSIDTPMFIVGRANLGPLTCAEWTCGLACASAWFPRRAIASCSETSDVWNSQPGTEHATLLLKRRLVFENRT